ncbi:MAG: dihydroorotate dehydrogenase [Chloroflexi bacterium]|nr:dihydroorotate dehydrogenase [Chloroflexota bacterium]
MPAAPAQAWSVCDNCRPTRPPRLVYSDRTLRDDRLFGQRREESGAVNLSVELAPRHPRGLRLRNPIMTASGTFGYGFEYVGLVEIERLGAIVTKGTTPRPRVGSPPPRVWETPAGLLNAIGLNNGGVEELVRDLAPRWAGWSVPVIANLAAERLDEFVAAAARLDDAPTIAALELNVSCPNVENGLLFGCLPETAADVTRAVRDVWSRPLIVKLTPSAPDVVAVAEAVAASGADALCMGNTYMGMAIDVERRRPALANVSGGLSGPAIKPLTLHLVYRIAQAVDVPIIGAGGVVSAEDAVEYLMAGATAVQVGTAHFANPAAGVEIVAGLERWLRAHGVGDVRELVGAALPQRTRHAALALA